MMMFDHALIKMSPGRISLAHDRRIKAVTGGPRALPRVALQIAAILLALAFLTAAASFGASAVPLTVDIIAEQPAVSIWLNETSPDLFSTMGGDRAPVKVVNIGLSAVSLTYKVDDGSSEQLVAGLNVDGTSWNGYSRVLASNESAVQEWSVDGEPGPGQSALDGGVTIWIRATGGNGPGTS